MSKTVEIDETELQKSQKLRATVEKMLSNPKARKLFLQSAKEVDPNTPIPELDAQAPTDEKLAALEKALADEKKAREDADAKREQDSRLASLTQKKTEGIADLRRQGWTDDGIKGVEKIMEEQGILDPAVAAAYFEKIHPPARPASPSPGVGAWNFMEAPKDGEGDDIKKLIESRGENEALLNKMASDALADIRGQRR